MKRTLSIVVAALAALAALAVEVRVDPAGDPTPRTYLEGTVAGQYTVYGAEGGIAFGVFSPATNSLPFECKAVYWDRDQAAHELRETPVERGGYHWLPMVVMDFDAQSGTFAAQEFCLEYRDWAVLHPDEKRGDGWVGPRYGDVADARPELALSADFNGDGVVDTRDYVAFGRAWAAQRER